MKNDYPKIRKFIETLKDRNGNLYSFYERNFRAALKSIPVVGNFLEANIFEVIDEVELAHTLKKLEKKCDNALTYMENLDEYSFYFEQINLDFDIIFVRNHEAIIKGQKELKDGQIEIKKLIEVLSKSIVMPQRTTSVHKPDPEFLLFLISGPSAVGKDVILDNLERCYFKNFSHVETLTKISTRRKRVGEHHYHKVVDTDDFKKLVEKKRFYFTILSIEHFMVSREIICIICHLIAH